MISLSLYCPSCRGGPVLLFYSFTHVHRRIGHRIMEGYLLLLSTHNNASFMDRSNVKAQVVYAVLEEGYIIFFPSKYQQSRNDKLVSVPLTQHPRPPDLVHQRILLIVHHVNPPSTIHKRLLSAHHRILLISTFWNRMKHRKILLNS